MAASVRHEGVSSAQYLSVHTVFHCEDLSVFANWDFKDDVWALLDQFVKQVRGY